MDDFKAGTLVKLKSGGPIMTVKGPVYNAAIRADFNDRVECTWFNINNEVKKEIFGLALLVRIEE